MIAPMMRAERQAAQERRRRAVVVVGRSCLALRRAEDRDGRRRSRSRPRPRSTRRAGGSRRSSARRTRAGPPSASPAHAPRIAATTMIGRRPPALPRMSTYSDGVEDPDQHRQDERRADAHAARPTSVADADRADGRAASAARSGRRRGPRRRRTARRPGPGAAAQTGVSVSTSQRPPRAGSSGDAGRTVAGIGVARWRIRISARNGVADRRARRRRRSSPARARCAVVSRSSRRPSVIVLVSGSIRLT